MALPHEKVTPISIHAPSRERLPVMAKTTEKVTDFNPRSLTGATYLAADCQYLVSISIHAPSRERPTAAGLVTMNLLFQSTLPHGSDDKQYISQDIVDISIHAPSRERPFFFRRCCCRVTFQSTLPHGSDRLFCF